MSKFEKPPAENQGNSKFEIRDLPRAKEGDVSPAGITYARKKSFKELPQAIQKEIVDGHISFEDAWKTHFGDMDGAYSVPLGAKVKSKIVGLVSAIENQDEASKEIFASLTNDEEKGFRNAVSLHISAGRNVKDNDSTSQPVFSNIAENLRVVMNLNRSFLGKAYNLKELNREAQRLTEEERKKRLASKYAKDFTLFLEASTADPDKIDFETQSISDQSLERVLEGVFAQNSSSNWHQAFMASTAIPDDIKKRILVKIKECQDSEDEEQGRKDPRHTGELTDSFLSTLNPERELEKIGPGFSFEGNQYEIFQLFTKKQLRVESETLGHCVGNTDTYFHAIREGRKNIFSVRYLDGASRYTIAYDQKEHSVTQFRGEGNVSVDPTQEKSELLLRVLNSLEGAGFRVSALREDVNYSIISENGLITMGGKFSVDDILKFLKSSDKNRVIKSELLQIKDDLPEQDLMFLSQAEGLALNLTTAHAETKKILKTIKGDLIDHSRFTDYGDLEFIGGNANFVNLEDSSGLHSLVEIGGNANFLNIEDSKGFGNLVEIGGNANFLNLRDSSGFSKLKSIGGNLNFNSLIKSQGLQHLRDVGGYANFLNLIDASGLDNLATIGGNVDFPNLRSAKGLKNLTRVGGNTNFTNLENADGLNNFVEIGGHGVFINLKSAHGLDNLKSINGNATFNRLRSASGLGSLKRVGRNANFLSLRNAADLKNLVEIGGNADFPSLQQSAGLDSLVRIGGNANFINLQHAASLGKLRIIGRLSFFYGLTSAELDRIKLFAK